MKPPRLSEADIQNTCDQLLMLDGWRVFKTDLPHLRGLGVQEPGMPDRQYVRYEGNGFVRAEVEMFWVEYKRRGGKAKQHQKNWHAQERARGALVIVASEDFEASVDGFHAWYRSSGLMRTEIALKAKRINAADLTEGLGEVLRQSLQKAEK